MSAFSNAYYMDSRAPGFNVFDLVLLHPVRIGTIEIPQLQSDCGIAIGQFAGFFAQGTCAIAIGEYAGNTNQGMDAIAIGSQSGEVDQGDRGIGIGASAAQNSQAQHAISIGYSSGNDNQGPSAIAVGMLAGSFSQGMNAIAIGSNAAMTQQNVRSIAIGDSAACNAQGSQSIAIGYSAASDQQGFNSIALGTQAGKTNQGAQSIAIGAYAGVTNQSSQSIILNATGTFLTSSTTGLFIAPVRNNAGTTSTILNYNASSKEISYGSVSGLVDLNSVQTLSNKILDGTNTISQLNGATVRIGAQAGYSTQQTLSIAIGYQAGYTSQASQSIAIGYQAGSTNLAKSCIAIGNAAQSTFTNSIILNAQDLGLSANQSSAFYVKPVRNIANLTAVPYQTANPEGYALQYNSSTGEISASSLVPAKLAYPAKALVVFTWSSPNVVVSYSYNVVGVTRTSLGIYTVNFDAVNPPFANANYAVVVSAGDADATDNADIKVAIGATGRVPSTTACPLTLSNSANTLVEAQRVSAVFY